MIRPATAEAIRAGADLLRRSEVVAFPTETVYGLGADATDPHAVARIFAIKARPAFDPLIVHVDALEMLATVARDVPRAAMVLTERFWPGPLTLVLPKHPGIPDIVTAGLPSVAVRLPDHPAARALIGATRRPIAAPSANPFGYISPTTAEHVAAQLGDAVPLILDGGPCRVGLESTIVSLVGPHPVLLRPGGVPAEAIETIVGPLAAPTGVAQPLAPGGLPQHYAPRVPLEVVPRADVVPSAARRSTGLLAPSRGDVIGGFALVEVLSEDGALATVAANLFAAMRRLDAASIDRIVAVAVADVGLGRAIMDRLRRAQHAGGS